MKKLAVLGHPIGHTLSPLMHNASIKALGLENEYEYGKLDVPPENLMERLVQLPDEGYAGVNLTIPLKEVAYKSFIGGRVAPEGRLLDESASVLGAINTIEFRGDGKMLGHNTDGYGFLAALEEAFGKTVKNDSVFILGCGGAGRAAALMATIQGAKRIVLSDLDMKRKQDLMEEIRMKAIGKLDVLFAGQENQIEQCTACDLVVQASPVGMKKDDPSLLPPEAFREGQRAFDLIYMYPETAFLTTAREAGAEIANGLGMLLHQGARAFEIWTGVEPSVPAMRRALEDAVYG